MSGQLVRQLEDCRRRIIKLEELHIGDPMYVGWMTCVQGRSEQPDTLEIINTLVRQPAFFYETMNNDYGFETFFFYSRLPDKEHPFEAMKPQLAQFDPLGRELIPFVTSCLYRYRTS